MTALLFIGGIVWRSLPQIPGSDDYLLDYRIKTCYADRLLESAKAAKMR